MNARKPRPLLISLLIVLGITLFPGTFAVLFFLNHSQWEKAAQEKLSELSNRGFTTSLEEVHDQYHEHGFDPADNAASTYGKAFAEMTKSGNSLDYFRHEEKLEFPIPEKFAEISAIVSENETALVLLKEASSYPYVRLNLDFKLGEKLMIPHIGHLSKGAGLLVADTLIAAAAHDTQTVEEALLALFNIGGHFTDEPLMISVLTVDAISRHGRLALELALTELDLSAETVARLQESVTALEQQRSLRHVFASEIAFGISVFEQTDRYPELVRRSKDDSMLSGFLLFYQVSGLKAQDKFGYLEKMSELIDLAELSPEEWTKSKIPSHSFSPNLLDGEQFQKVLFPLERIQIFFERNVQTTTYLRVIQIGLAAERFRLATGQFPEKINELVPEYLETLPTDPYNPGGHFEWIREDSLYSIRSYGTVEISGKTIPIEFGLRAR